MDVVEHAEVAHAGVGREHAVRGLPAHGQARSLEVADARHEHFFARAVIDGHAHVDGGDLDPAHHGVAVEYELPLVGLDLVGGKLGSLAGEQLVVRARLEEDPLPLLRGKGVHRAGHGTDLVEDARRLEPVEDPGPHHEADADEDDDHGDEPVGPARQAPEALLGARGGDARRVALVLVFHRLGASGVGRFGHVGHQHMSGIAH